MVREIVEIVVRERGARQTAGAVRGIGSTSRSAASSVRLLVGAVAALGSALAIRELAQFTRGAIEAAASFESFGVRLRGLLGSQQEANTALENFVDLSSRTPFAVADIVEGASTLAAAALGNRESLEELTETAANLAAVTGLSFQEAAGNLQRSLAGGIGAADLFRERGVRALIEEIEGIPDATKLTTEELDVAFRNVFGAGGVFGEAAQSLSLTLGGALSNVGDAATNFRVSLGQALSPVVINAARNVFIPFFQRLQEQVEGNDDAIRDFAATLLSALIRGAVNGARALFAFIETFQQIRGAVRGAVGAFLEFRVQLQQLELGVANASNLFGLQQEAVDETTARLARLRSQVAAFAADDRDADLAAAGLTKTLDALNDQLAVLESLTTAQNLSEKIPEITGGPDVEALTGGPDTPAEQVEETTAKLVDQENALSQLLKLQRDLALERAAEIGELERELFLLDEQIDQARQLGVVAEDQARADAIVNQLLERRNELLAEAQTFDFGNELAANITGSLETGIADALRNGQSLGDAFATSFGQAANNALTQGLTESFDQLQVALEDVFAGVADSLPNIFGDSFPALGDALGSALGAALQFVALQAVSALFGGGGNESSTSTGRVQSAVTSSEAVRGIVAGPQEIAIAQVGDNLAAAVQPVLEELQAQTGIAEATLRAIISGGGSVTGGSDADALAFTTPASGA